MRAFRHWSGARIALLSGAWAIGVPLASVLLMTLRARHDLRAYAERPGASLPSQATDLIVVASWRELLILAVLVVVPPLLLFMAWRRLRDRGDGDGNAST
ncbi:MAG TPA: hypothetical protein VFT57_07700 [Gemmatimonadaceae bacterium]|nr:hypothetical protein [Gemmatimonadaceae bacterium]